MASFYQQSKEAYRIMKLYHPFLINLLYYKIRKAILFYEDPYVCLKKVSSLEYIQH